MPSFSIRNFGCRANQAEAFGWAENLRERGLRLEDDPGRGDLVVINACTLTARADRDVRRFVERAGLRNPGTLMVVTGCLGDGTRAALAGMPRVRRILPNSEKDRLADEVLKLAGDMAPRPTLPDIIGRAEGMPVPAADGAPVEGGIAAPDFSALFAFASPGSGEDALPYRSRGLLKVQDGCDQACAFCVIPSMRGKSRSTAPADVLGRVGDLVDRGYREIVLSGIHLSSYGHDLEPRTSLLELLRGIEGVRGLGRVRLSSLDPRRTDAALVEHVAGNPAICQHFHLSLQHASPRVLREMGRGPAPDAYEGLLRGLRERSPEAALGADIIVGFPGETEEDFTILVDYLERSPLTYIHVFSYSPRAGTPAAGRPQLPGAVKRRRAEALRRLSADKTRRFHASFVGREFDGVAIRSRAGRSEADASGLAGETGERNDAATRGPARSAVTILTGNAIAVSVPAGSAAPREMVRVRVERVLANAVEGAVVR